MCAYTQVDGALACESEDALKNLLKEEVSFLGVSDPMRTLLTRLWSTAERSQ